MTGIRFIIGLHMKRFVITSQYPMPKIHSARMEILFLAIWPTCTLALDMSGACGIDISLIAILSRLLPGLKKRAGQQVASITTLFALSTRTNFDAAVISGAWPSVANYRLKGATRPPRKRTTGSSPLRAGVSDAEPSSSLSKQRQL
jgi:hypothetical protein